MTTDPRDELDDPFDDAALVGMLAAAIAPVEPPAGAKAALFTRVSAPPSDGPRFRFAGDGAFVPTPFPGMTIRMLNLDRERKQFTAMIRLEPGATYPGHAHDGPEECVVLEGELLVGGVRMKAGDYQRAEPGTEHADQWSDTGALLYVSGPASLLST